MAEVLHGTHAFYYADLISGHERLAVQRRVYELMNRMRPEGLSHVEVPNEWFPSALPAVSSAREHPVVSFVVPVYNAEKYIAVALETLRRQTLTDFEVICVDDGSIDDSGEILDFYSRVDPRIKVWHLENGGVSRARNFGLAQACGRYVAFFDGDDRLWPQMAARTVLMAACGDLDAVLFDFSCFTYDSLAPLLEPCEAHRGFPARQGLLPGRTGHAVCLWIELRLFVESGIPEGNRGGVRGLEAGRRFRMGSLRAV